MRDLLRGINALRRGFALLVSDGELRRLALLPFLLNVFLFAICLPLAAWKLAGWAGSLLPGDGAMHGLLAGLLELVVAAAILLGGLFLFSVIGSVIATPFSAKLAGAIERRFIARNGGEGLLPLRRSAGAIGSAGSAVGRLVVFLLFYPPILALQLIPVAGVVLFTICSFLYGTFVLSYDFSDPAMERHLDTFGQKRRYLLARKGLYLGFGGASFLLMLIPVANLLLLPICIAGGTLLYLEEATRS
jgi:CysZ protein